MKRISLYQATTLIAVLTLALLVGIAKSASSITVSPNTGTCMGDTLTIAGSGMPEGTVSLRMISAGASAYREASLGPTTADASGNWSLATTVPTESTYHWKEKVSAEAVTPGDWNLEALGADNATRSTGVLTVLNCRAAVDTEQPARQNISVSPGNEANIGDTITINGSGAQPNAKQQIDILAEDSFQDGYFNGVPAIGFATVVSDADGNWSLEFTIPSTAHIAYGSGKGDFQTPLGEYIIRVNFNGGGRRPAPGEYGITRFYILEDSSMSIVEDGPLAEDMGNSNLVPIFITTGIILTLGGGITVLAMHQKRK